MWDTLAKREMRGVPQIVCRFKRDGVMIRFYFKNQRLDNDGDEECGPYHGFHEEPSHQHEGCASGRAP
jgi:hypothetical protein